MKVIKSQNSQIARRESQFLPRLIITIVILLFVSLSVLFITRKIVKNINEVPSISKVYEYWNNQDYQKVYETCDIILKSKPYNPTVMAYKGYASYCLSISQSDLEFSHEYIDTAINCLRLSLIEAPETLYPQICYMLGKSYFHKNSISAYYYYADSAVYYLNEALKFGFSASDISRYLGLSYAQLSMTEESIKSFSEALLTDENDNLLLAIAEQYIKNGQPSNAKQYLFRIRSISNDEIMILKACEYLASIYVEEGNYNEALSEYNSILEKDPYNADVYYGIGVIYEKMGDMAKARAEWRKALKVQVNHAGALKKLN